MPDDTSPVALVVEDNALILIAACDILEEAGFRPLQAMNAEEAIEQLEGHAGDITLLFTDIDMPGDSDGLDLARETAQRWAEIRILIASGAQYLADEQLPERTVFVRKPFSAQVVHARLQELLPDGAKPEPLRQEAG